MSVEVVDPLGALCAFLQAGVGELLAVVPQDLPRMKGGVPAVFRPDMPKGFDAVMPLGAIVVRDAGGYARYGSSMMPLGDPRADVTCYGASQMQSSRIARASIIALKQLVMEPWEGVMLHAANISGGPLPLPDEHTLWPATWFAVQLVHGELPSDL